MATNLRKGSESTRKSSAPPAVPKSAATGGTRPAQRATTSAPDKPQVERTGGGDGLAQSTELERRIAERAYEIYLQRGAQDGDPISDWLQAEAEIRGTRSELDESKARSVRTPAKQQSGTAPDKEMQEFNRVSAGGI